MDLGSFSFSDTEQASLSMQNALTWRLDPEESFSDWTIQVFTSSDRTNDGVHPVVESFLAQNQDGQQDYVRNENTSHQVTTNYHVHKHMLGAGQRSSLYFARMFKSTMAETCTSTSRIELDDAAADAFPIMLDFMYSQQALDATTDSAVALRYLANYFGIESLFHEVNNFIEQDLGPTTLARYVEGATLYQDEKMLDAVEEHILECWDSALGEKLMELPPPYFLRIIKALQGVKDPNTTVNAEIVASYCLMHEDLELEFVRNITLADSLTEIIPEFAIKMIHLAVQRNLVEEVDGKPSLKQRAIEAAAVLWFELSKSFFSVATSGDKIESAAEKRRESGYDNLSTEVKLEIFERAIGYRQQRLEQDQPIRNETGTHGASRSQYYRPMPGGAAFGPLFVRNFLDEGYVNRRRHDINLNMDADEVDLRFPEQRQQVNLNPAINANNPPDEHAPAHVPINARIRANALAAAMAGDSDSAPRRSRRHALREARPVLVGHHRFIRPNRLARRPDEQLFARHHLNGDRVYEMGSEGEGDRFARAVLRRGGRHHDIIYDADSDHDDLFRLDGVAARRQAHFPRLAVEDAGPPAERRAAIVNARAVEGGELPGINMARLNQILRQQQHDQSDRRALTLRRFRPQHEDNVQPQPGAI